MPARILSVTAVLVVAAAPAAAQLISIRTVPISQAHQFDLFPSLTMAMGGVSIAIRDSLHDPFANPAKGSRIGETRFFTAPSAYSATQGAGAGLTLPAGALVRAGGWFGGLALAAQQVDMSERFGFGVPILCPACVSQGIELASADRTHGNGYAFAMLGKVFPSARLSLGGSVFWSGLKGIHGIDLLYAGSTKIEQDGNALDLRVGALKEFPGDRSLTALVVHNRFGATHDVLYLDSFWDPGTERFAQRPRWEQNLDRSRTWGLHLEYVHPLEAPGWRLGWIATTNLASHPKIPNYEIQNIPRDPGNSQAFNFGVGISKTENGSTYGLDLIYEPIWSHTWADSDRPIETARGAVIAPGGKTIENRFRFTNAMLRMGLGREFALDQSTKTLTVRLGLSFHRIHYTLRQRDNVQLTARSLRERWLEWTPTWGVSLRYPEVEIHYRGSVPGTGRLFNFGGGDDVTITEPGPNILAAPSGPLALTGLRVMTHQVAVSFPIR